MYDTIKLELEPTFGYYSRADMERVQAGLTQGGWKASDYNSVGYVSGHLKNLKIYMTDEYINITGSICKYIKGNQFEAVGLEEIKEAIEGIGALLGLPVEQAIVKQVDFAINIITHYEPVCYFPFFGKTKGYRRQEWDNGIYYKHTEREFNLYNKIKEMKRKRKHQEIPPAYRDKNVLRIELALLQNIPKQLQMGSLTAARLYDLSLYQKVQAKFLEEYNRIYKHYEFAAGTTKINCTADLIGLIILLGVKALGGMFRVFELIEHLKQVGKLTSGQAYQCRAQLKVHERNEHLTTVSPLIEELDQKVQELTSITPLNAAA